MSPFDKDIPDLPVGNPYKADKLRKPVVELDVSQLTVEEILDFRGQLEAHLPAKSLKDLDLAKELVIQVLALQEMQRKALESEDTPVNQLAQAANSLSAALVNLVKLQADVYSSERFKRIEQLLIETLQELPAEQQEKFLTAYESVLEGSDGE